MMMNLLYSKTCTILQQNKIITNTVKAACSCLCLKNFTPCTKFRNSNNMANNNTNTLFCCNRKITEKSSKWMHYTDISTSSNSLKNLPCVSNKLQTSYFSTSNLTPGKAVLSLDVIVNIIKENHGLDLFVVDVYTSHASIPADYAIIVSGRSRRHLQLMASVVTQKFKSEARAKQQSVKASLHGEGSSDWIIADLGETVIHFMLPETREVYDLESLWLLGSEYDEQSRRFAESDSNKEYVWKTVPKNAEQFSLEENQLEN